MSIGWSVYLYCYLFPITVRLNATAPDLKFYKSITLFTFSLEKFDLLPPLWLQMFRKCDKNMICFINSLLISTTFTRNDIIHTGALD